MPDTLHLRDIIAPGDPPIKVASAYHTTLNRHDHDFYELVYVTEGFCLHETRGAVTLLMEGDIFILRPWVSHRYVGNGITRIYNCLFSEEALSPHLAALKTLPGLNGLFGEGEGRPPHLHLTLGQRKRTLRLIEGMNEDSLDHPLGWDIRLRASLVCLLVEYARAYDSALSREAGETAYSSYVTQAMRLIEGRYADPRLTVQALATAVGVSGDYLSRQFRRSLGVPAQEYLRRYRFARAIALLETDAPVGTVALKAGFGSAAHFSREFRREMGLSPSQYRKQNTL